jgi:hypothetical protein
MAAEDREKNGADNIYDRTTSVARILERTGFKKVCPAFTGFKKLGEEN